MRLQRRVFAADDAATRAVGAALAGGVTTGVVIHLLGDLGAGKTTLARGLIQALLPETRVKSPTYALAEEYRLPWGLLLHWDLYRLADPEELDFLGLREQAGQAALLIEWPDRGGQRVPPADLTVRLTPEADGRRIELEATTALGRRCLDGLGDSFG
jgi:tRNA threonylcarbamoyladenosine biosynthesis protein TsaE